MERITMFLCVRTTLTSLRYLFQKKNLSLKNNHSFQNRKKCKPHLKRILKAENIGNKQS